MTGALHKFVFIKKKFSQCSATSLRAYEPRPFNGSFALQCFERGNAVVLRRPLPQVLAIRCKLYHLCIPVSIGYTCMSYLYEEYKCVQAYTLLDGLPVLRRDCYMYSAKQSTATCTLLSRVHVAVTAQYDCITACTSGKPSSRV